MGRPAGQGGLPVAVVAPAAEAASRPEWWEAAGDDQLALPEARSVVAAEAEGLPAGRQSAAEAAAAAVAAAGEQQLTLPEARPPGVAAAVVAAEAEGLPAGRQSAAEAASRPE